MNKSVFIVCVLLLAVLGFQWHITVNIKTTSNESEVVVKEQPRFVTIRILEIPNQADAALLMDTETHKFYTSHLRRFSAFTPSKSDLALAKQYRKDTNGKLN